MPEENRHGLAGLEVAITGKLASMSREEARARIDAAGGSYVPAPREGTDLLLIGQGGPPLGEDGRLTKSLQRAHELREAGAGIEISDEDELLKRLGLEAERDGLHREYTTAQLARILGIEARELRFWVRHGLIQPVREHNRLYFFEFPQVASAKALSELTAAGVTPARIRRSLQRLDGWLPHAEQMLGQLEVLQYAGPVLLRTEDGTLAEPNGQLCFEFEHQASGLQLVAGPDGRSVDEWFDLGLRAERDGRVEDAVRAYRSALRDGDRDPEVHFSLGNALYGLGRLDESLTHYERAVELAPDYVEAWNNLGILLGEMEKTEDAVRAYRRALSLAPEYPDALYNLAETLVTLGELDEARALWRTYLRVDPQSPFAKIVRERLARL
ncbi:MAG: tetratricopeptide repeat protein [Planctomycetota bacterium]